MIIALLSLPAEVILEVFKILGWRDILRVSETCRTFFEIAQDRSIWTALLRDSPTLFHRPTLEAPIDEYTTHDLKNIVLRNISSTLGWNSSREPQERTTPEGDFVVGEEKILLEGGRWLLSFGGNLTVYNPDYSGAILAYDLDSPEFSSTIIYKDTIPERDMVLMKMFAQVDRTQSCLAYTVGLIFEGFDDPYMPVRFEVLRIEQRGRGPEAKLLTSTIKSLSCWDHVADILGDYAIITYFALGATRIPYRKVKICNWRTSSSNKHAASILKFKSNTVRFDFLRTSFSKVVFEVIRILPENKILVIEPGRIAIYRIPELHWAKPSEVHAVDGNIPSQQPIWSASLSPEMSIRNVNTFDSSKPSYGPLATRLAFTRNEQIYGLVIPHDGRTPTLHVLATVPELPRLMFYTMVTVCIDKIYGKPWGSELKASMLSFSWPEEVDLRQPTAWVPPILHFTHKQFAGHSTSATRVNDLVDEISGRVVTGWKDENYELPEEVDEVCWSVVDFFHPRFLPSSFKP
ncbi:hypothetical protein M413DRAFT_273184 [Hebeloma cylindrosporum]|uniref:F-box domain-containing protein n=1 Tax=Hebeloma cylindrosporum TaxID=76867 RepID=A0A0C3CTC3_HEBCY|nr:hypothetical protein M413DRAFT_273184 [Hebeloma cylindrosporum h7]